MPEVRTPCDEFGIQEFVAAVGILRKELPFEG